MARYVVRDDTAAAVAVLLTSAATLSSSQILASLVYHFDVEMATPEVEIQECADVTLGPKQGMPIIPHLRRRHRTTSSKL